jgi:predicted permease
MSSFLNNSVSEFRMGLRALGRAPGFTSLAVCVLGLGLGANLLLFNAVQALLWRSLPFPEPQRLACLLTDTATGTEVAATGREAAVLQENADLLEEVGLVRNMDWEAPLRDQPERRLACAVASPAYFRALGLRPLAGRLFGPEEEREEGEARALLTEPAWRRVFGADPGVVGRTIRLASGPERGPVRIVGILAGNATLPCASSAELLFPVPSAVPQVSQNDANGMYTLVTRLKPGVTFAQASSQVSRLLQGLPGRERDRYRLLSLRTYLEPDNQGRYLMLLGASGLLLLLTAVNAASLFLARAIQRSRETAMRLALGAGLARLLRSQLVEAVLVCGAGLLLAFGINAVMREPLLILLPELRQMGPELLDVGPLFLGFALLMTAVVCVAVCLMPLLRARDPRLVGALAQGGRMVTRDTHWGRNLLVTAQMTAILVLLSLGALLTRSLGKALGQGPGFDPRGVQVCRIQLPDAPAPSETASTQAPGPAQIRAQLAELAAALPGTSSASFAWQPPFGSGRVSIKTSTQNGPLRPEDPSLAYGFIGPDYFRTVGSPLRAGREFSPTEVIANAPVVVLNESAARRLFPGIDPLDKVIHSGLGDRRLTVIGVCGDQRTRSLDRAPGSMIFVPFVPISGADEATLLVRTRGNPGAFAQGFRERLGIWHGGARLLDSRPLDEMGARTVQDRLRAAALVGGFALLGLCIGCIGLYGTLSSQASEGRREVGIRMALGSSALAAAGRILAKGARPVVLGLLLGLGASLMIARLVSTQLYGIGTQDPGSHLAAIGLLLLGSLLAFLIPLLRAARVQPAVALREG